MFHRGRSGHIAPCGGGFISATSICTTIGLCYLTVHQESIVAIMDSDERILMATLARVSKTKSGHFSENEISRKHDCMHMRIEEVLTRLQELGLVSRVKNRLWKATPDGKMIEHHLNVKRLEERNPGLKFPGC